MKPRRRGKDGKRRNAPSSTERLMLATARKLGITAKLRKTTDAIPRCLDHAFESLGFSSAWDLARFIEDLAGRSPGKKGNVRLPSWKTPEGGRYVVAVRCRECKGRGCRRCDQYGWGIRLVVAINKGACAKHDAPPTTPASTAG
jgi:hypothetical protein